MGGDRGYAKGTRRIPSPGGKADDRDDGDMWSRQGVGITSGGSGNRRRVTSPHWRVHQEAEGKHSVKGGLSPHL